MYENMFKSIEKWIEKLDVTVQQSYTDKFINFMQDEYLQYHYMADNFDDVKVTIWENDEEILNALVESNTIKIRSNYLPFRRNSDKKLVWYLTILQDVDRIHATIEQLLSSREAEVQSLALKLIGKTSTPFIKNYMKTLETLVSDSEFKEELSKFSLREQLSPEHRETVLPYIIRILVAKLHRKVGKSARKSLDTKRSLIYRFLSSLSTNEFGILINLMIEPFKIKIDDVSNDKLLEAKLCKWNFRMFQGYSAALEGIIKHLGTLIEEYLPLLLTILTTIYKLTRIFYNSSKSIEDQVLEQVEINDDEEQEEQIDILDDEVPEEEVDVGHLKKDTLKRCTEISKIVLKRTKEIYEKYFFVEYIQGEFSLKVLTILHEGIEKFSLQNITRKSALLDIFHVWSKHPDLHFLFNESTVIDQLCKVLSIGKDIVHYEVYTQIFVILKNIVLVATGEASGDKRDAIITENIQNKNQVEEIEPHDNSDEGEHISESDEEDNQIPMSTSSSNESLKIVKSKLPLMISSIADFLQLNWEIIKAGILGFKQKSSMLSKFDQSAADKLITNSEVFRQRTFIKRIVYILSEISVHVNLDQKEILEKLTGMLIPLVTIKGFITSNREDLTNHTIKTIERLCEKMPSLMTITRFYKISRLLAETLKITTRLHIWDLLYVIPDPRIKESVELVKEMNKKKKSKATIEFDYDAAIAACNEFTEKYVKIRSYNETVVGLFQLLWWSSELSIRTASVHAFELFFDRYLNDIKEYANEEMKPSDEEILSRSRFIKYHFVPCILASISTKSNEMKLKACFKVFRKYLLCIIELHSNEATSKHWKSLEIPDDYIDLKCVIDTVDENVDFFNNILNIKLQRRYKAIRQLWTKIEDKEISSLKTLTKVILVISDMFVLRLNEFKKRDREVILNKN